MCVKYFFCLGPAVQVATSGQESAGSGISATDNSAPGPSRAPQLVRARSGPATLSHAVFEMLYVELRSVLAGLRKARTVRARERARSKAAEANNARRAAATAAAGVATAAAAPAVDAERKEEGRDEETDDASEKADRIEVSSTLDGEAEAATPAGASAAAIAVAVSGEGGEGSEGSARDDGEEEGEEEEKAVFGQLADMRDDLGCLKLSRELQVCQSVQGCLCWARRLLRNGAFYSRNTGLPIVSPRFISSARALTATYGPWFLSGRCHGLSNKRKIMERFSSFEAYAPLAGVISAAPD